MGAMCVTEAKERLIKSRRQVPESQAVYWTAEHVGTWIELIGLKPYKDMFLDNGLDGSTLLELRRDQFERCLGLTNPMHELSLRCALIDLKTKHIDYTRWQWSHEGVLQWLALRGLENLIERFSRGAVHGGVLFRMRKSEFASRLSIGEHGESEIVLESLWRSVERARNCGYYLRPGEFQDWGPNEIQEWLETIHLGHLHEVFREHSVCGAVLPYLSELTMRRVMKLTEIQTIVIARAIRRLALDDPQERRKNSIDTEFEPEHRPHLSQSFEDDSASEVPLADHARNRE